MDKFSVNYAEVQSQLTKKKKYLLADVKHRLQKVAFDVVRFVDSDKLDDLWKIEREGDDEYIVAMYDESIETPKKLAHTNPWSVIPDDSGENLNVFYKQTAIKRVALAPLGIPASDAHMTSRLLRDKFASDAQFLGTFLNELTEAEKDALVEVEPSLLASK